jgi:hypothetical protein
MTRLLSLIVLCALAIGGQHETKTVVEIRFSNSSYADFLFYLLARSTRDFPELTQAVPLDDIKPMDHDTFVPLDAASSKGLSYHALYKLVSSYDDSVQPTHMLSQAESKFPAFEEFWRAHIGAEEDRGIARWKKQYAEWHPIERLEQLERVKFPFDTVNIDVIALDTSASSMQGPPTIFTTYSSIPDIAWVLGHEGTHMALGPKGANWMQRPRAAEAIALAKVRGGGAYDIEEALCLLMQVKLSQAFGGTPSTYRASSLLVAPTESSGGARERLADLRTRNER